jgi:hypothetical protein
MDPADDATALGSRMDAVKRTRIPVSRKKVAEREEATCSCRPLLYKDFWN